MLLRPIAAYEYGDTYFSFLIFTTSVVLSEFVTYFCVSFSKV